MESKQLGLGKENYSFLFGLVFDLHIKLSIAPSDKIFDTGVDTP